VFIFYRFISFKYNLGVVMFINIDVVVHSAMHSTCSKIKDNERVLDVFH